LVAPSDRRGRRAPVIARARNLINVAVAHRPVRHARSGLPIIAATGASSFAETALTLNGTAEAGTTVELLEGGISRGTISGAGGT
jgi:hypothetical protein